VGASFRRVEVEANGNPELDHRGPDRGVIAKLILPGRDPGGFVVTIVIVIVGAILGGFIVGAIVGGDVVTAINFTTILVAILGAIVLLLLYRLFVGRHTGHR
jgi:uncharacterized membrane protein YeaQ/YmgE (transglycosylase-associated protein family)